MEGFFAGRLDHTGAENSVGVFGEFNDAVACGLYTGIDSEDPHQIYL